MEFGKSEQLRKRARHIIPGGCHTYCKGDDQFPELAPGFIVRGEGCHVWDVDGNEFIEYGLGNRCVTLGHARSDILEAAQRAMRQGINFTRPAPIEVECAEKLLEMIDGAEMAKFCKDESTAITNGVKLARAHTGREIVACCNDQSFLANDDWYIGTTPVDAGVPQSVKDLTLTFRFNNTEIVRSMFQRHPNRIAAVVLQPAELEEPRDRFLHELRQLCHENGTVFILDESITGFRWHNGGGQAYYDVRADLAVFGKAMGNGFSVAALVGQREIMELGGLEHDRERVFLLSSTHGAETHALAAALETMKTYQREPVIEHLFRLGGRLQTEVEEAIDRHGLSQYVQLQGKPCYLSFTTRDENGNQSQAFRSLFLQETIRRGILMTSLAVSYAHVDEDISRTVDAIDEALGVYRRAINDGIDNHLVGRPAQVVHRRYNESDRSFATLPAIDTIMPLDGSLVEPGSE